MTARSAIEAAFLYAQRFAWPVFPCQWEGPTRKRPLIAGGFRVASTEKSQIERWWRRWPLALIGLATGHRSGVVVLDVDRKGGIDGFDTLAELGAAILPVTPLAHTASGGLHIYFRAPDDELRNTIGARGRGLGWDAPGRVRSSMVAVPTVRGSAGHASALLPRKIEGLGC